MFKANERRILAVADEAEMYEVIHSLPPSVTDAKKLFKEAFRSKTFETLGVAKVCARQSINDTLVLAETYSVDVCFAGRVDAPSCTEGI